MKRPNPVRAAGDEGLTLRVEDGAVVAVARTGVGPGVLRLEL